MDKSVLFMIRILDLYQGVNAKRQIFWESFGNKEFASDFKHVFQYLLERMKEVCCRSSALILDFIPGGKINLSLPLHQQECPDVDNFIPSCRVGL